MAAFRFNLQPVLEQRERIEEDRTLAVARLESERLAMEHQLREYQGALAAQKGDLRASMGGAGAGGGVIVDPARLRVQAHASLTMQVRAQRVVLQLAGVHRRLEAARVLLAAATRDRRAVEVLRERRFARWKAERDRREAAAVDEIATGRAARRISGYGDGSDGAEMVH
jgi:flagellar export protein FliJ